MGMTWILVADQTRARLFCRDRHHMVELDDFLNAEGRDGDGGWPSSRREGAGPARRPGEPHGRDGDDTSGDRFARSLSELLERGHVEHRYDDLVLVAPAAFLGTLSAALSRQVSGRVIRRIDKDLTRDPVTRLRSALAAVAH